MPLETIGGLAVSSKSFIMYFQSENEAVTFLKYLPTFLHFMMIPFKSIVRDGRNLHVEI